VDLMSSKVCGIGLLNIKAQHLFYPFERDKFRCIPKIKLYRNSFFGCQANDLSFTDIVKQYSNSWLNGEATPKYWKDDVIAGIVSGFATSIITVFIVRILRHVKSWFPRACCSVKSQFSKVNLLVQVKRCMLASCLFLFIFLISLLLCRQCPVS
ncbi:predicted protein, partial [Arabidopsis lyrata subsp. lyrata]